MGSKMLIDAAHPEETRVVVVRGNRVEEFDYESAQRKQLRGNIYLAKVTRVEPSLQAAFVDYGGNRHGFLAFSEIHPDYYQIPVADRQALLEEEAEEESRALAEEAAYDDGGKGSNGRKGGGRRRGRRRSHSAEREASENEASETESLTDDEQAEAPEVLESANLSHSITEDVAVPQDVGTEVGNSSPSPSDDSETADTSSQEEESEELDGAGGESANEETEENVESVGSEDAMEEVPVRTRRKRKRIYKIQEVIKRRQIILIQVVKEERGNKGAALTTYLSLAGRYTVLMPNTARGGGISRKITNATDRKRLRKIASDLDIATGMGLIIRTAGASRTKTEIKRDCEYLLRMWENIRDLTLQSTAPALVYEEGNLIKRSIRDLYNKEIDEVQVSGDEAYMEAKGFMRMLMPSHAKNVQPYKGPQPIFVRHKIERQLSVMISPYVTLRSGGYIVINQTEALVSVDVNSGKATREHSIEDTALKTNLEAAEETARQLRLRDLAGLIVIDFIDMDERRNNRAVERRIKESLRGDRARIQVGRISHFGLLEMSRQRLRTGMLEGTTSTCPMCQGTGMVRSTESVALDVLRSLEDALLTQGVSNLRALMSSDTALYILNYKRSLVRDIESRYGISILIHADPEMHGASFTIEKTAETSDDAGNNAVINMDSVFQTPEEGSGASSTAGRGSTGSDGSDKDDSDQGQRPRRRRRRGRGRGRGRGGEREASINGETLGMAEQDAEGRIPAEDQHVEATQSTNDSDSPDAEDGVKRPRRRGRRGGRRTRTARAAGLSKDGVMADDGDAAAPQDGPATDETVPAPDEAHPSGKNNTDSGADDAVVADENGTDEKPKRKPRRTARAKTTGSRRSTRKSAKDTDDAVKKGTAGEAASSGNGQKASETLSTPTEPAPAPAATPAEDSQEDTGPKRGGWWQRRA